MYRSMAAVQRHISAGHWRASVQREETGEIKDPWFRVEEPPLALTSREATGALSQRPY